MLRTVCLPCLALLLSSYAWAVVDQQPPKETRPPTIVPWSRPEEDTIYFDNENKDGEELPCRANGDKPITFEWTRNGQLLDLNDPKYISNSTKQSKIVRISEGTGDLLLTELEDDDAGVYQCIAKNQFGTSMSKKINFVKATKRTFGEINDKRYSVHVGESLKITCNPPENSPPGRVVWVQYYDIGEAKRYVELNGRVAQDNEGNLYFANVLKTDENFGEKYACEMQIKKLNMYVEGAFSYIKVLKGNLTIQNPTQLVYNSDPDVVALKGENTQFKCIFSGNPTPEIKWYRLDGKMDKDRMKANYQKLNIYYIEYEDAGIYECRGKNSITKSEQIQRFTLQVEAEPEWLSEPRAVDAGVEESAVFECAAEGKPEPTIQWYINGNPLGSLKTDPRRHGSGSDGQLQFSNLSRDDAQVIQCNASNKHGYLWADVPLSILAYKPELLAGFTELKVAEGHSVVLPCKIDGKPKPTVYWKRGGIKMEGPGYPMELDGNLTIRNAKMEDEGEWVCYAENRYGKFNTTGKLIVREKTKIRKPPSPTTQMILHGVKVRLECSATTDPKEQQFLTITWLLNGKPVDQSDPRIWVSKSPQHALEITPASSKDTGTYTCLASNGLDSDKAEAVVNVMAPPDPPTDVTFATCLAREATVSWKPSKNNFSPIIMYYVEYNHSYSQEEWHRAAIIKDPSQTEVKITLSPFANYTFRVIAVNSMGESEPSVRSTAVCESNSAAPDKNPENFRTDRSKPGVLIIEWDRMPPIDHNGEEFRYRVSIRKDGKTNQTEIFDWKENSKEIDYGKIYEPYEVYVEAININGVCPTPAVVYKAYTGEAVPLVVPKNFELVPGSNVTSKSAKFQWDPVDTSPKMMRGKFTAYEIRFWKQGQRDTTEKRVEFVSAPKDPKAKRATKETGSVINLPPFSNIEAELVAKNTLYASNASEIVNLTTPEGVPGPVRNANVLLRGHNHFLLKWDKPLPEDYNGILTGYQIGYQKVKGFEVYPVHDAVKYDDPDELRAYIDNLEESQEYRIFIWATTSKGKGEDYFIDAKTANSGQLLTPIVEITLIGEDFINVTWRVGHKSDNPAGQYHFVQYRKMGQMDWIRTEKQKYNSWMNVSNLQPNTEYEIAVVAAAANDQAEQTSELTRITTKGDAAPTTQQGENIAQATWFILMMVAIAVLIIFLIVVCFIKRSRGEKYNVQEQEKLGGADPEAPDANLFSDYPKSGEKDPLAAGSPDSFDNDPDKLPGGSETDSMAEYGDVDPSKFNEDGSFIGQYGSNKPEEKGNQPSAMSTFV